jgi:hypothetical protein
MAWGVGGGAPVSMPAKAETSISSVDLRQMEIREQAHPPR